MTLEELKAIIESKKVPEQLVIFKLTDNDFIPNQYISFIESNTKYTIEYRKQVQELIPDANDIFAFSIQSNVLNVLKIDTFDCEDEKLKKANYSFIICNKISKNSQKIFEEYIISIPKLEEWQISDYANSVAIGIDNKRLTKLVKACSGNIYRLDQELQKLALFPENQRTYIFDSFMEDGALSDLSNYNIFNFSNALVKRDAKALFEAYRDIQNIDVEPVGLMVLMINSIKRIIDVQLTVNSSPETLNMKPNQYWATKYSCGFYTKEELMRIYSFLTSLDKKIKLGEMPVEHLVDYIVIHILGV